jgi:hypothetical protein
MRKTQKIAIVGTTVGILMAGGVAYAAWTSEGTGNGTATAGSQTGLVVTGGSAVDSLFPTKSVTFPVTISNKNPYDVQIRSLDYDADDSGSDHAGCGVGDVDVVIADATGDVIGAGSESTPTDSDEYTATVTMHADAASECQGATFTFNFDASADSNVA